MDNTTTTSAINTPKTNTIKKPKKKTKVIRNLLAGGTLSTALVSWYSTALGMNSYIFNGNLLFAFAISGAVQGSLFALSIAGLPLIKSHMLKGTISRILLIVLWFFLLLSSSIFSFVYISKTAYPDRVLRSDADQNMSMYLQEKSYENLEYVSLLENKTLQEIADYTMTLRGGQQSGFSVKTRDKDMFNSYIDKFEKLEKSHNNTNTYEYEYYDTSIIRSNLETIKSGVFTSEELKACKANLLAKKDDLDKIIDEYDARIEELNAIISQEDARLKTFAESGKTMSEYRQLFNDREDHLKERDEYRLSNEDIIKGLKEFRKSINNCYSFVAETFEKGTENKLNELTNNLYSEINRDRIDTIKVLSISEEIYKMLLDGNTSANTQTALTKYANFKQSIRNYRTYIDTKQLIEDEIGILGNYNQQMLLNNKTVLGESLIASNESSFSEEPVTQNENNLSNNTLLEPNDESIDTDSLDVETQISTEMIILGEEQLAGTDQWAMFWDQRLANMLKEMQDLPTMIDSNHQLDKASLLRGIMNRRRLYLVQLNDFDRALSLLKETMIGFHERGTMVIVSILFSFALDLFSLGMGILLYMFKPRTYKTANV